jgi:hypothetical protein
MQLDISNQLMSKEILMLWHENECFHWHLADDQDGELN